MTKVMKSILERASLLNKHIVLPEGEDARVVAAAAAAKSQGIANVTLLGDPEEIKKNNPEIDLNGVEIIDPKSSPKCAEY
ncbi:MAG: phosphate acetyltransferase, partial [Clostridia bacterium]|nr:phosphate acetyltransferase [Clostridia bacterium]